MAKMPVPVLWFRLQYGLGPIYICMQIHLNMIFAESYSILYGCLYKLRVLFVGVLIE